MMSGEMGHRGSHDPDQDDGLSAGGELGDDDNELHRPTAPLGSIDLAWGGECIGGELGGSNNEIQIWHGKVATPTASGETGCHC